jgi:hypothetical protein
MFAWLRRLRIRSISIGGITIDIIHPPDEGEVAGGGSSGDGPTTGTPVPPPKKPRTVPPGARFTANGTVIRAIGKDLGIRVRNEAEMREFWRANEVDTDLDWFGPGAPVCSIGRARDKENCRIGDEASLTFEVVDRAGGKRGTRTVEFEVRPRA